MYTRVAWLYRMGIRSGLYDWRKDRKNVSVPILNPDVETGDVTDGVIGYRKRRLSLKQGLAGVGA